ncbi:CHD5-like protein-domain-containing protein [Terfezia claveryi]|nr:CHD5-like protein-domain-containing protein [Terfezia claveryi]
MLPLAILVLAITTFSYLLNTVFPDLLTDILWYTYTSLIPSKISSQVAEQQNLRVEVFRLKKDLRTTSAQDEFAKWAKLRRNHDAKVARLEVLNSEISSTRLKFTSQTRILRFLLTTGFRIGVQIYYFKSPVFYIPKGWVPGYFELLLAFPKAPRGSVSVQAWALACGTVVELVVGKVLIGGVGGLVKNATEKKRRQRIKLEAEKEMGKKKE